MKNSVVLKIPNDKRYFTLVKSTIKKLVKKFFSKKEIKDINLALKELINNVIKHAYIETEGLIEIEIHMFNQGIRIDVKDFGFPMSKLKHLSSIVDSNEDNGFNKIHKLVDKFDYINLGKDGKVFTIIKYLSKIINFDDIKVDDEIKIDSNIDIDNLKVRYFKIGDEEAVSQLIYLNYGHTYYKEYFYYPQKILECENKKIYSVVAEINNKVIGHFALARVEDSNIAEIGIAVVNPIYKGLGIMNKMFDKILAKSKELKLFAIYGEALMYHEFSQKSNLSHNFCESALEIGKIPQGIEIKNNKLSQNNQRGSVLIGYKILFYTEKKLYLPKVYKEQILSIYNSAKELNIQVLSNNFEVSKYSILSYKFDPFCNVGTIIIDRYGKNFVIKFKKIMSYLLSKHCDMIYVDVNLEQISNIDEVVKILNRGKFFYSGIIFFKHKNFDYLHLQYRHSDIIGEDNFICYSNFAKKLYKFILKDELRVEKLK